jgi:hypothetical protein
MLNLAVLKETALDWLNYDEDLITADIHCRSHKALQLPAPCP